MATVAFLAYAAILQASPAQYFYDALGRLRIVVDGQGSMATYNYDAVGNLLSITPSGTAAPPVVTSVVPATIAAGLATSVTINGTGFQFASVTTANPEIQISNLTASGATITATFTVPNPTAFGPTSLTITGVGGATATTLTVHQPAPTISQLTPATGVAGATVVIQGTGLGTKTGGNLVTFAGLGSARLPAMVVREHNTSLTVTAPAGVVAGPITVQVAGLTSNGVEFTAPALTGIVATAATGVPSNFGLASANAGQLIMVQGLGLSPQSTLVFPTRTMTGASGTTVVSLTSISADGTSAQARVPFTIGGLSPTATVVTGPVTIQLAAAGPGTGSVPLQIVPHVENVPSLVGAATTVFGDGFDPSGTQVRFPGVVVPVPASEFLVASPNEVALQVTVPSGVTPGVLTVTTTGGTSNNFIIIGLGAINAVAGTGTPVNPAVASANAGHSIQLQGLGFGLGQTIVFPTTSGAGVAGATIATVFSVSPDGTTANVQVRADATTGLVVPVASPLPGKPLQIVPTLFTMSLPDGEALQPGVVATLSGNGFKEGATTVTFPGATAPAGAVDVAQGNHSLTVPVPSGLTLPAGTSGAITVSTDGGASSALAVAHPLLTAITGTAAQGAPQNPAQPSANAGQTVTITGAALGSGTLVLFPSFDSTGAPTTATAGGTPSPDGASLTVTAPSFAVRSGTVSVQQLSSRLGTGAGTLQIVPTVANVTGLLAAGASVEIIGSGFDPNGTQVQFPGVALPVVADPASVWLSSGTHASVLVPAGVDLAGQLTVITSGGASNSFSLSSGGNAEVEPNDSPATATTLLLDPSTLDVIKSGTMKPVGDVDFYRFDAFAGVPLGAEVLVGDSPAPGTLTIRLTWLDQDGVTVLATAEGVVDSTSVPFFSSVALFMDPPVTGGYFLKVEELTGQGGPDRAYQIHVAEIAF